MTSHANYISDLEDCEDQPIDMINEVDQDKGFGYWAVDEEGSLRAFVKIDRNQKHDNQNVDPFDQMLNPSLGGQPGNSNSLQISNKRLMNKPRNRNRRDHEIEVDNIDTETLPIDSVKEL